MKLTLAALALAALTMPAQADDWTGPDKTKHFVLSAGLSAAVTVATKNEWAGVGAALAVGVAKEVYDYRHRDRHTPSAKDLIAGVAGGYVGAKLGGLVVIPQRGGGGGVSVWLVKAI